MKFQSSWWGNRRAKIFSHNPPDITIMCDIAEHYWQLSTHNFKQILRTTEFALAEGTLGWERHLTGVCYHLATWIWIISQDPFLHVNLAKGLEATEEGEKIGLEVEEGNDDDENWYGIVN